jgi:hypothetical protein
MRFKRLSGKLSVRQNGAAQITARHFDFWMQSNGWP